MRVIGITGGVGAGKSTVLNILKEISNCMIIMADTVAKDVIMPWGEGFEGVVEVLGKEVLAEDGTINRAKMADIIFSDFEKKEKINSIIHPLTKKKICEMIEGARQQNTYDYVFVEAALLIEDHYDIICEELWYIYADKAIRTERLINSRGYSLEKCKGIMANQLSDEEFREHCSFVIDNSKDTEYTKEQLIKKVVNGKFD